MSDSLQSGLKPEFAAMYAGYEPQSKPSEFVMALSQRRRFGKFPCPCGRTVGTYITLWSATMRISYYVAHKKKAKGPRHKRCPHSHMEIAPFFMRWEAKP